MKAKQLGVIGFGLALLIGLGVWFWFVAPRPEPFDFLHIFKPQIGRAEVGFMLSPAERSRRGVKPHRLYMFKAAPSIIAKRLDAELLRRPRWRLVTGLKEIRTYENDLENM